MCAAIGSKKSEGRALDACVLFSCGFARVIGQKLPLHSIRQLADWLLFDTKK